MDINLIQSLINVKNAQMDITTMLPLVNVLLVHLEPIMIRQLSHVNPSFVELINITVYQLVNVKVYPVVQLNNIFQLRNKLVLYTPHVVIVRYSIKLH